jgi:hypothetical protein
LDMIFQAWVRYIQEVSEGNGDYVGWSAIFIYKSSARLHQTRLGHVLSDRTVTLACREWSKSSAGQLCMMSNQIKSSLIKSNLI